MITVSEIEKITIESYIDTLRVIEQGDTRYYRLVGSVYSAFHNAKTRLAKKDFQFEFERLVEDGEHYLKVKRIK